MTRPGRWRLALDAMIAGWPAVFLVLLSGAAVVWLIYDRFEVAIVVIVAQLLTLAAAELLFYAHALRVRRVRPERFWSAARIVGFLWRWAVILTLFAVIPIAVALGSIWQGFVAVGTDVDMVMRLVATASVAGWAVCYAFIGLALPEFLSGRGGSIAAAARRPGFGRRLREVGAPAGTSALAWIPEEIWLRIAPQDVMLGVEPSPWVVAGYYGYVEIGLGMVADLLTLFAIALMAVILTDEMSANTLDSARLEQVFE